MKIDWVRKLSSRKFWLSIIGFVTPIMQAFGAPSDTVTKVTAIIIGAACLIIYILSESYIDAKHFRDIETEESKHE